MEEKTRAEKEAKAAEEAAKRAEKEERERKRAEELAEVARLRKEREEAEAKKKMAAALPKDTMSDLMVTPAAKGTKEAPVPPADNQAGCCILF